MRRVSDCSGRAGSVSGRRARPSVARAPGSPGTWFIVLALLSIPSLSPAQSPTPLAAASAEQKRVQLSESVQMVLVIAGPAPLRVQLPNPLLASESERDWKIAALGPGQLGPVIGLPGWECRLQNFRLDPYVAGNALPVAFAPLQVNGTEIVPTGFEVTVLSSVTETKPESARPVTGIEQLPPAATVEQSSSIWWVVAALGILAAAFLIVRLRKQPQPVPPREWATAALDHLEQSGVANAAMVEGAATVIRGYIDRGFGVPAPKLTTGELLIAVEQAGWPVEETDPLRRLLEVCDRAKFAGDVPDNEGCRHLLAGCRDWVDRISSDTGPR